MKLTQIVFSPTGGTRRAADALTSAWGPGADDVDLTDAGLDPAALRFTGEDVVLLAVPSYGGRVPPLAARRIAEIRGNQARCVLLCVYGNRAYEDTLMELYDVAVQSGFHVTAAVAAIAEHSIIHQYAAGRPDGQDREELRRFAGQIAEKLSRGDAVRPSPLPIPGNRPYKKVMGAGLVPKADDRCTRCGLCARRCPARAISPENLRATDSRACISCMRCVTDCPQSARRVNSAMVSVTALAVKKACSQRKGNELYL